jgi:hypothetical protein
MILSYTYKLAVEAHIQNVSSHNVSSTKSLHTKRPVTERLFNITSPCNNALPEQNVSVTKRLHLKNVGIWPLKEKKSASP